MTGALPARLALAAALLLPLLACTPPAARQYCEEAADCDDASFVGLFLDVAGDADDSVEVCTVEQQTRLDALRVNREEVCHELADAYEAFALCVAEEGCDALQQLGDQNPCWRELEDISELTEKAGNRCSE